MNILLILILNLDSPVQLYNRANQYYNQGKFEQAIELYEKAVEKVHHPFLYYNLGNAYFKLGKIGKAIVNYRRARFLSPRDKDINHNLIFVRNYRPDKMRTVKNPLFELLSRIFHILSFNEARIFTTFFFLIGSLLITFFIIYRRQVFAYLSIIVAVLVIYNFIVWQVWAGEKTARPAVITVSEVHGLSGPGEDYKEILVIHDGTEVKIKDMRGDYYLIQLPGGMGGWIPRNSLTEIF